jgi:hypothetical protein
MEISQQCENKPCCLFTLKVNQDITNNMALGGHVLPLFTLKRLPIYPSSVSICPAPCSHWKDNQYNPSSQAAGKNFLPFVYIRKIIWIIQIALQWQGFLFTLEENLDFTKNQAGVEHVLPLVQIRKK